MRPSDPKTYKCKVENRLGVATQNPIQLIVRTATTVHIKSLKGNLRLNLKQGETWSIHCGVAVDHQLRNSLKLGNQLLITCLIAKIINKY